MCGIIGFAGKTEAVPILLDGLERLEYRGYDSAGVAVVSADGRLQVKKSKGSAGIAGLSKSFVGEYRHWSHQMGNPWGTK